MAEGGENRDEDLYARGGDQGRQAHPGACGAVPHAGGSRQGGGPDQGAGFAGCRPHLVGLGIRHWLRWTGCSSA